MNVVASKFMMRLYQRGATIALVYSISCLAAETASLEIAIEKTEFDSMRLYAQRAFASDSSDPKARLSYAETISNISLVQNLYKRTAAQKSAPDSIRAEAYYRLACIAYMASNYNRARSHCVNACMLSDKETYRSFCRRGPVDRLQPDSTSKPALHPAPVAGSPHGECDTCKKNKKSPDTVSAGAGAGRFCLQVGAFSAIDHAQGLKNELGRRFSHVAVTAGQSNGKNVYRVRVGGFVNKETAQAFGDSALVKKGIVFRVVEE
jgi:cell division septation protein DedD